MPSGVSDDDANAAVDWMLGTHFPSTLYMDLLTTAPSDDNGTDAVSWDQGRVSVDMTSVWSTAADRQAESDAITSAANSSGDTITVVAVGFYDDPTAGSYRGGFPVDGGSEDIDDGETKNVVTTFASPSPS
jgi:hypothetical protein